MKIQLSDHFTYKKLIRFIIPSVAMMIFTSIYGVVDGFFVSNFAGKTPFAAINLIMPFLMILGTVGFMFGTGGSALVAKTLGEGDRIKANRYFSLFVYIAFLLGTVLAAVGIILITPIARMLGAEGEMLRHCIIYGRIILCALPFFVLQLLFQSFFITAEKPQLGFVVTLISGVINMVLDASLVGVFRMGVTGAALATALSQITGGSVGLIYFFGKNTSLLRLGKTSFDINAIAKAAFNGLSEFMNNIAMSIVSILYNIQLLKYAGENGIATYGVLMYVSFVFAAAFIGYSIGVAPVIGYHYGAQNHSELKNLRKKSMNIVLSTSVVMTAIGLILAKPLSAMFVGYDKELLSLTVRAFMIFALSFLFMGVAIFSSGFFTALNDGLTSAVISFLRTLVFEAASVMILPLIFDINGVWFSIVVAEFMAFLLSLIFIKLKQKHFKY